MRRLKLNSSQRPTGKKMSCAQLIQQAREGAINLESPESILSQVNLRTLLNKGTFSRLPPLYQFKLMQLLPQVPVHRYNVALVKSLALFFFFSSVFLS
jgi:hypothetical protein